MKNLDTSDFIGTTQYYRFTPLSKGVLTDGTYYVAKETNNFGLMQDILIDCMRPEIKEALDDGLVVVEIDTESFGLRYEDGNGNKILGYPLTGYPPLKIRLFLSWVTENKPVIYLPSEY